MANKLDAKANLKSLLIFLGHHGVEAEQTLDIKFPIKSSRKIVRL